MAAWFVVAKSDSDPDGACVPNIIDGNEIRPGAAHAAEAIASAVFGVSRVPIRECSSCILKSEGFSSTPEKVTKRQVLDAVVAMNVV